MLFICPKIILGTKIVISDYGMIIWNQNQIFYNDKIKTKIHLFYNDKKIISNFGGGKLREFFYRY